MSQTGNTSPPNVARTTRCNLIGLAVLIFLICTAFYVGSAQSKSVCGKDKKTGKTVCAASASGEVDVCPRGCTFSKKVNDCVNSKSKRC